MSSILIEPSCDNSYDMHKSKPTLIGFLVEWRQIMMRKYSTALSILFSIAALHANAEDVNAEDVYTESNYTVNVKVENLTDSPVAWQQTETAILDVDAEPTIYNESLLAHGIYEQTVASDQELSVTLSDFYITTDESPCLSDAFTSNSSDLSLDVVLQDGQCIVREHEVAEATSSSSFYGWW